MPITNKAGKTAAARVIQSGGKNEDLDLGACCVLRRARLRSGVSAGGGFRYEEYLGSSLPVVMIGWFLVIRFA